MRFRDVPALCAALIIAIIGGIAAQITGANAEDDLDEALGEE